MIGIIAPWEDLAQLDPRLSLKSFFTNVQMLVLFLLVTEPDLPGPILEIIQITCISFSLAHMLIILHLSATTKVYNILYLSEMFQDSSTSATFPQDTLVDIIYID